VNRRLDRADERLAWDLALDEPKHLARVISQNELDIFEPSVLLEPQLDPGRELLADGHDPRVMTGGRGKRGVVRHLLAVHVEVVIADLEGGHLRLELRSRLRRSRRAAVQVEVDLVCTGHRGVSSRWAWQMGRLGTARV
jgi:hypothetical protein